MSEIGWVEVHIEKKPKKLNSALKEFRKSLLSQVIETEGIL